MRELMGYSEIIFENIKHKVNACINTCVRLYGE